MIRRTVIRTVGVNRFVSRKVGIPGASAYEIAVSNGFEGTEEEWLESLGGGGGSSITVSGGYGRFSSSGTDYKFPVFEDT